jgi:ABC-type transport system substrate-binding protein
MALAKAMGVDSAGLLLCFLPSSPSSTDRNMKSLVLLANHEMTSLEPNGALSDSSSATLLLKTVCPGLVRFDHNMTIVPALARNWTTSVDRRRWRFFLQTGARFHNGRPVSAETVAWNYRRLFDGRVGSVLAKDYAGLDTVQAVATDVVEFVFGEPFPWLLYHLAWRTHVADDTLDQPVGTGAFRLVEWARGSHLLLERHAGYWEPGAPRCDRLKIVFAPDAPARTEMIERGAVDIVENVPATLAASLAARGLIETAALASGRKSVVVFNCAAAPFDDLRIRRAVSLAIDRAALRSEFYGDKARPIEGVYVSGDPWAVDVEPIGFDPVEARRLMAGVGTLRVRGVSSAVFPTARVAARIVEMLRPIGIDIDLHAYDDPPWWPFMYLRSPWQVAFHNMGPRPHPDILFGRDFVGGGAFNPSGYASPELDAVWSRARRCNDNAEAERLYAAAQHQVRADMPFVPLYATDMLIGWRPGVTGVRPHPMAFVDLTEVDVPDRAG